MYILLTIHKHFLNYYDDIQEYVLRLENDSEFEGGLIEHVEHKRNDRIKMVPGWIATNGIFYFIILIFSMLAAYGGIRFLIS